MHDADVINNGRFLLQQVCINALCIANIFFQHIDVLKNTLCRYPLGQRSLIFFCIASSDLSLPVLDSEFRATTSLNRVFSAMLTQSSDQKSPGKIHEIFLLATPSGKWP